MRAIHLSEEAANRAFAAIESACQAASIPVITSQSSLVSLIEEAVMLSLDTIEDAPVTAAFLIPPRDVHFARLASPMSFVRTPGELPVENLLSAGQYVDFTPSRSVKFDIAQLKSYVRSTGDGASFIVLGPPEVDSFTVRGLLFLPYPISEMLPLIRNPSRGELRLTLSRSLIITIRHRAVTVSLGNDQILRIHKGNLTLLPENDEAVKKAIGACRKFYTETAAAAIRRGCDVAGTTHRIVSELVYAISNARHGATLIFNARWNLSDESRFQPGGITTQIPLGALIVSNLLNEATGYSACQGNDDELITDIYNKVINDELEAARRAILNLCQNDGALIFDECFCLRGAGVFLKAPKSVDVGGSRHRSADSFIVANPSAVALVISQDGTKSIFAGAKVV